MEPSHRISKVPFSHPSQSAGLRKEVLHPFSLSIEKRRFLMPCVGTFISVRRNLHSKFLFRILQLESGKVVPISFSGNLPDIACFPRLVAAAAKYWLVHEMTGPGAEKSVFYAQKPFLHVKKVTRKPKRLTRITRTLRVIRVIFFYA